MNAAGVIARKVGFHADLNVGVGRDCARVLASGEHIAIRVQGIGSAWRLWRCAPRQRNAGRLRSLAKLCQLLDVSCELCVNGLALAVVRPRVGKGAARKSAQIRFHPLNFVRALFGGLSAP